MKKTRLNFGAYDPRFLGTQVYLDTPEAVQIFHDFYLRRKIYQHDFEDPESINAVWLGSVIEHETRHYHDALISPYSSKLLRLRVEIMANFDQIFHELIAFGIVTGSNCMPVPLQSWLEVPAAERRLRIIELEATGFFGQGLRPFPLPVIPNQVASPTPLRGRDPDAPIDYNIYPPLELCESWLVDPSQAHPKKLYTPQFIYRLTAIKEHYDQIDHLLRGAPWTETFQPWQVFEASAVIVQMKAAQESCTGLSPLEFLASLDKASPRYTQGVAPFFQCDQSDLPKVPRAILLCATWAMFAGTILGKYMKDWTTEDFHGAPGPRFSAALSYCRQFGMPALTQRASAFFAALDEHYGCPTWRENLQLSLALDANLAEKLSSSRTDKASAAANASIDAFLSFVNTRRQLFEKGFDLERYVDPQGYLPLANNLPLPPMLIHLERLGWDPDEFDRRNAKAGWMTVDLLDSNLGPIVSRVLAPHPMQPLDELRKFWHLFNSLREIDHLFCRHHRRETRNVAFGSMLGSDRFQWLEM